MLCSAEYILQVIGAGASATVDRDWHKIWKASSEAQQVQVDVESIHDEGRKRPAIEQAFHSEYATSWTYQVSTLFGRDIEGARGRFCYRFESY